MDLSRFDRKKLLIAGGVLAALLVAVLAFALTRGGGEETAATTTSGAPTSSSTTADLGPVSPLTGLPQPDEALRNRPLLTIKIDNSPQARPQFGVDKADTVVEEKVEGGISRFMALFQSQDSDRVGPVRSLRTTDPAWLRPEGGLIAYSGGIDGVKALLGPAGITDIGADNHGPTYYKRRSDRAFEHSLYTNTSTLRTLTPKGKAAAKPLFEFVDQGASFAGEGVAPVQTIQGRMGGDPQATTFAWTWDPSQKKFLRTTDGKSHLFEGKGQIAMTNVVIQYTPYRPTQYRDRANAVVDEAVTTGSGDALILSDGKVIQGRWNRPNDGAITSFTDSTGATVKLNRGQSWLQLVPQDLRATVING